ncbi:MAG: CPBP family intramembrane metalloprotease, partial [Simkaniaceae bacterium]|nr:CPBP family intramembrane metalloprotease [Simkaniaceae bacterium]
NESDIFDRTSKVALGIITGFAGAYLDNQMVNSITDIMVSYEYDMTCSQEAILLLDFLGPWYNPAKILLISYITLFGPIIEEVIFREGLHQCYSEVTQMERICVSSVIFGLMHLSPLQGWVNIPIVCATTFLGAILHILREMTGDIIAPSAAHITNNTLAIHEYLSASQ